MTAHCYIQWEQYRNLLSGQRIDGESLSFVQFAQLFNLYTTLYC